MAQLPDDLKTDAELGKYETLGALAKDYKAKLAELSSIERPPQRPEEYELKLPELPEDVRGAFSENSEFDAIFRKKAIEAGLTKKQAAALYGIYHSAAAEKISAVQKQYRDSMESAVNELKKSWGSEFDAKVERVRRFMDAHGTDKVRSFFDESGIGNHPAMIEWVAAVAEKFGEHTAGPEGSTVSPDGVDVLKVMYPSMKEMPDRVSF